MKSRTASGPAGGVLLMAAAGALLSGCAAADREAYSVILRKPAHRYRPYTDPELKAMATLQDPLKDGATTPPGSDGDRSEIVRSGPQLGRLDAFRPFSYCYLHATDHAPESLIAVTAAPAEFPIAIGTKLTADIARATVTYVGELWSSLFPPAPSREMPVRPPERPGDR